MPDEAAYASNWWRILLVDVSIGVGAVLAGLVLAFSWSPLAWGLVALGVFYTSLVIRRVFKWRDLRRARPDPE